MLSNFHTLENSGLCDIHWRKLGCVTYIIPYARTYGENSETLVFHYRGTQQKNDIHSLLNGEMPHEMENSLFFLSGAGVEKLKTGDRVLINTTTQCGKCVNCKAQFFGHCDDGGWQLGTTGGICVECWSFGITSRIFFFIFCQFSILLNGNFAFLKFSYQCWRLSSWGKKSWVLFTFHQAFVFSHCNSFYLLDQIKSKWEKNRTEPNELDKLKYSKSLNQTTSYTYWHAFLYLHA